MEAAPKVKLSKKIHLIGSRSLLNSGIIIISTINNNFYAWQHFIGCMTSKQVKRYKVVTGLSENHILTFDISIVLMFRLKIIHFYMNITLF